MKRTPRNVDRLRTLQLMLKISTPATISNSPFNSSFVQLLAIRSAAARESLCVSSCTEPGLTYSMVSLLEGVFLLFADPARRPSFVLDRTRVPPIAAAYGSSRQGCALVAAAHLAEPVEGLALELPAPLLAHAESLGDLAVGLRFGPVEPVAGDDHAA